GPVVKLWRQSRKARKLPDPEMLAEARALVGYQNVRLDAKGRAVRLLKAGMQLDLGGIAKGYAADEMLAVLKRHGLTRARAAAGDIAVSSPPPGAEGWKVAVAPLGDEDARAPRTLITLILHDAGVSTSGDAEQFVEIDGKRYSHIVDPRTGLGLVGRMSATVVARDGTTADPYTKVVAVLGPERGLKLIEATDAAAALFVPEPAGRVETSESKRFSKFLFRRDR